MQVTTQSAAKQLIQLVDADAATVISARGALEAAGFRVRIAINASEALWQIQRFGLPHLLIVAARLPQGMDGFRLCELLHTFSDVPVIMLVDADEGDLIVRALETCAEDCLTRPLNPAQLAGRARRILHRLGDFGRALDPVIQVDDHLAVDFFNRRLHHGDDAVTLTAAEARLLYVLMRSGDVVPADFIARRLWPSAMALNEETVRKYVHRLRGKMRRLNATADAYITSYPNAGYRFAPAGQPLSPAPTLAAAGL